MTLRSRAAAAAARLPPWLGLVLALASLAIFHALATMAPPAAIVPERLRSVAVWALVSDLSGGFQWGFPVIFLTWTLASTWARRKGIGKRPGP